MIVDLWNKNKYNWDKNQDGKLSYVLLKGEPGHPDAEATAMWDGAKAKDKMDGWMDIKI